MTVPRRLGSTEIAAVAAFYVPSLAEDLPKDWNVCDVFNRLRWGLQKRKTKSMNRGNREEPTALAYYRKHVGPTWRAMPDGQFWTIQHPRNEWFTASPDAFDAPRPRIVIEAKTWNENWGRKLWGEPGTDHIATRYHYQAQWLMSCCDAEQAHVLVLFGHDVEGPHGDGFEITEPAIYPLTRNAKTEALLLDVGERFINDFVLPGIPPPVKSGHNRRAMKEKLENERGRHAVDEWEARCIAHAAELGAEARETWGVQDASL